MTAKKPRRRKIQWMLKHRELWEDLEPDGLWANDRKAWRAIVDGLKADGLISHKTSPIDVAVEHLINAARDQMPSTSQ